MDFRAALDSIYDPETVTRGGYTERVAPPRPTHVTAQTAPLLERNAWRSRAACRDMGPATFYPDTVQGAYKQWATPRLICNECPVSEQCLNEAIANREPEGMWGGVSPSVRRRMGERRTGRGRRHPEA